MSRASSPAVSSSWNGSGALSLSTVSDVALTSMSPVAMSALALPSGRTSTTPVDGDAELGAQPVRLLEHVGVAEHHLRHAGGVAQVDEDDAAVVAPPRHPSGQRHRLTGVGGPQRTGGMTAQHENSSEMGDGTTDQSSGDGPSVIWPVW